MGKLTPKQKKELEDDVKSQAFIDGKMTTSEISRKYGLSWKRAKDAVNATKQRIEYARQKEANEEIPMETITAEQLQETELANETPREAEERDEFRYEQSLKEKKPVISLIETPPTAEAPKAHVLDGNKFYCGTCLKNNRQIVLAENMTSCPGCGGVLLWAK